MPTNRVIDDFQVVVVGCGIAGMCAGTRAAELGNSVAILEKSPKEKRGGQTRLTGAIRFPYADTDFNERDIRVNIRPDSQAPGSLEAESKEASVVLDYSEPDFYRDVMKVMTGDVDTELIQTLASECGPTMEWLTEIGVEWEEVVAYQHNEFTALRHKHGEGKETIAQLIDIAEANGAQLFYNTEARELQQDQQSRINGLIAIQENQPVRFDCDAVIIAAGGFDSNPEKRTKYLGADFGSIPLRGSRYNTGEALDMALDIGAMSIGDWGDGHITLVDPRVNTDNLGGLTPEMQRRGIKIVGYTFGILVNHDGERFVDEGRDSRDGTYAVFGRDVFEQPHHEAFSIVDSTIKERTWWGSNGPSDPIHAESIEDLAHRLGIQDIDATVETIADYNAACDPNDFVFPLSEDTNSTEGMSPPKSHWAFPITDPPFYGLPVTGGITFVPFGGLQINTDSQVINTRQTPIPGLYAAGNSAGGVMAGGYKSTLGQPNGATFGKLAAEHASEFVDQV